MLFFQISSPALRPLICYMKSFRIQQSLVCWIPLIQCYKRGFFWLKLTLVFWLELTLVVEVVLYGETLKLADQKAIKDVLNGDLHSHGVMS